MSEYQGTNHTSTENRLANLTFSFHNSARIVQEAPKIPYDTNRLLIESNLKLRNKTIILDDNNLQNLFKQARDNEQLNSYNDVEIDESASNEDHHELSSKYADTKVSSTHVSNGTDHDEEKREKKSSRKVSFDFSNIDKNIEQSHSTRYQADEQSQSTRYQADEQSQSTRYQADEQSHSTRYQADIPMNEHSRYKNKILTTDIDTRNESNILNKHHHSTNSDKQSPMVTLQNVNSNNQHAAVVEDILMVHSKRHSDKQSPRVTLQNVNSNNQHDAERENKNQHVAVVEDILMVHSKRHSDKQSPRVTLQNVNSDNQHDAERENKNQHVAVVEDILMVHSKRQMLPSKSQNTTPTRRYNENRPQQGGVDFKNDAQEIVIEGYAVKNKQQLPGQHHNSTFAWQHIDSEKEIPIISSNKEDISAEKDHSVISNNKKWIPKSKAFREMLLNKDDYLNKKFESGLAKYKIKAVSHSNTSESDVVSYRKTSETLSARDKGSLSKTRHDNFNEFEKVNSDFDRDFIDANDQMFDETITTTSTLNSAVSMNKSRLGSDTLLKSNQLFNKSIQHGNNNNNNISPNEKMFTVTDSLMSFDAEKDEQRKRYKKEWLNRRNGINDRKVSHSAKNNFTDNRNAFSSENVLTVELQHHEWDDSDPNEFKTSIDERLKMLNFDKNRINSNSKDVKKNHDKLVENNVKPLSISEQYEYNSGKPELHLSRRDTTKKQPLNTKSMTTNNGMEFSYSSNSRTNSDEIGSIFNDGYSSGSSRTAPSESSDSTTAMRNENDFIVNLTNEMNFRSQDADKHGNTTNNIANTTKQTTSKSFSNLHEILNEEEQSFNDLNEHHSEEENKRKSIHLKLEDLLKAKVRTLDGKSSKTTKNKLKFPDPLLAEKANTLPSGSTLQTISYDSIDGSNASNVNKRIDASFHDNNHPQTHSRENAHMSRLLQTNNAPDTAHIEKRKSLMSELRKTVSRRTSIELDDLDVTDDIAQHIEYRYPPENIVKEQQPVVYSPKVQGNYNASSLNEYFTEPNLYDSFPLSSENQASNQPHGRESNINHTDNVEVIHETDEEPINKNAVTLMLKSHLKDKTRFDSLKQSKTFPINPPIGKKFSFTSMDMKREETSNVSLRHDSIEELQRQKEKLSLESEEREADFFTKSGRKDIRIISSMTSKDLRLTESEHNDIKKSHPFVVPVENHGTRVINPIQSADIIHLDFPAETDQTNHANLQQLDSDKTKQKNHTPVAVTSSSNNNDIHQKRNESHKIFLQQNIAPDKTNVHQIENITSPDDAAKSELNMDTRQDPVIETHQKSAAPVIMRQKSETEYYLPENNEEKVIKPSEYRIHKFKDRYKYRAPTPPSKEAVLNIDATNIINNNDNNSNNNNSNNNYIDRTNNNRREKRAAPHISVNVHKKPEPEEMEMERERESFNFVSMQQQEHPSKSRNSNGISHNQTEKWVNEPYVPTSVGKVNIPTTFQTNHNHTENTNNHAVKDVNDTPRVSSGPSTPKRTRRFSFIRDGEGGNTLTRRFSFKSDKSNSTKSTKSTNSTPSTTPRPNTPSKFGDKFKQFFSPRSTRKLKKSNSMESLSSGMFSPRSDEDITRRKNMNGWGLNDDVSSRSSLSESFGDEDDIDASFISNEEWVESHRSSSSNGSNQAVPHIKAPMIPSWNHTKKTSNTDNIGRVIVPDAFNNNNNIPPLKINSKSMKMQKIKKLNGENNYTNNANNGNNNEINFLVKDVAFNSLDVNKNSIKKYRQNGRPKYTPAL